MWFWAFLGNVLGFACIYYFLKHNIMNIIAYILLALIIAVFDLYTRSVMIFLASMAGLTVIVLGAMIWRDDARKKKEKNNNNVKKQ